MDEAKKLAIESGISAITVQAVASAAGVTKGGFLHHFPSKQALGLAVIDEILAGMVDLIWSQHLKQFDDPIEGIAVSSEFARGMLGERTITLGCPLNNLAQEMSGLDEAFRARIESLFRSIVDNIAGELERGKRQGFVRQDVDSNAAAIFILASLEGAIGIAKSQRSSDVLNSAMNEFGRYLNSLRATGSHQR